MSRGARPRPARRRSRLRRVFWTFGLFAAGVIAVWVYLNSHQENLFGDVAAKLRGPALSDSAHTQHYYSGGPEVALTHAPQILSYETQPGDTLASLAKQFSVPMGVILSSNDVSDLEPGQTLRIPKEGVLHRVKLSQTLTDIALSYGVTVEEIVQANSLADANKVFTGQEIFIPGVRTSPRAKAIELSRGKTTAFVWPLFGELSSYFGQRIHPVTGRPDFHEGLDIEISEGTPVYASQAGRVIFAGRNGGYGLEVIIEHRNNYRSAYGHLSEFKVHRGQFVEGGQLIALSGNTGLSTGPHLHFEIRQYGRALNPLAILP